MDILQLLCSCRYCPANVPQLNCSAISSQPAMQNSTLNRLGLTLSLIIRPTVSRPVCLAIKHPSGAYDQIFNYCQTDADLLMWGALCDKRTGLSFTIAAGPRQRSYSRVRVPLDPRPYFTVSDSRLFFWSHDSQGYGGGIRPRLHTGSSQFSL
jgi:hypothetical protein